MNANTEHNYAGFWIRLVAQIIDGVLMTLFILLLSALLLNDFTGETTMQTGGAREAAMMIIINLVVPIALYVVFWNRLGGTPGKLMLKLRVIDANTGQNISVGKSLLRVLGYVLATIPVYLGFIWAGFDREKRGWHDMIAGTRVIRQSTD